MLAPSASNEGKAHPHWAHGGQPGKAGVRGRAPETSLPSEGKILRNICLLKFYTGSE